MVASQAARAADLLNTFGVDTHINYTDGGYANIAKDLASLQYLGINRVRDAAPTPANQGQDHLHDAASAGTKFVFYAQGADDPAVVVQRLHAFAVAHPGSIIGIEGPNEVNNWPVTYKGLTGTAGAQAYQAALFNAVNGDPLLKDIPVIGFTDYPNHASVSDYNNIHPYPKNGDAPRNTIAQDKADQEAVDPGKPFIATEGGYHTSLTADTSGGWEGVSAGVQAKLLLNFYMDSAQLGAKGTYVYELLDAYPDPGGADQEKHFGLFNLDYSPKPAATAIHNMTTILKDGGSTATSFTPGALNYSVTGLPSAGHVYLTAKSNGSFQLTAWNEPDIWDQVNDRAITVPTQNVRIDLGQTFGTVQVFDPLVGTTAIKTLQNVSAVDIGLSDHPLIVQVSGATSPPPPTSGVTLGSGPDKLVLKLSEDAYKGDAQFVVKVDGAQIGGVQTAHALHSTGQSEMLTVLGAFGSSAHKVSVTFLNDAWGGNASLDRNLYLEGATYNGTNVSGAQHKFAVAEAFQFNFGSTTPPPTSSGVTIGSGPDKLVLKISEDAYKGDAQFVVKVDGVQIGGVQTAHALHSAGDMEVFNVLGTFGAGHHDFSVRFLNDAWGGTAATDRNLYLESATYNGESISGASHKYNVNSDYHFGI